MSTVIYKINYKFNTKKMQFKSRSLKSNVKEPENTIKMAVSNL